MPKVIYKEFGGAIQEVEVPVGFSVMEGAVRNGVRGIEAECGGACACATCHVYVDDDWLGKVGAPSESEKSMLEFVIEVRGNSRLSCQISVSEELNGLSLSLPERQR